MMTLADLQAELGARLLTGTGPTAPATGTPAERAGWSTTRAMYRQRRVSRIRALAPLTLVRLGGAADLVIDAYLAANAGSTWDIGADAAGLLAFAAAARPDDAYLAEIAFLEQALIRARQPDSADVKPSPGMLARSRRASLRILPFPPDRLMRWLSGQGARPNQTPGGARTLVAPGIAGWIRPATAAEAGVWHWLAMDRPVRAVHDALADAVHTLRQIGAVR